jgi:hypothetical protein
MRRGFVPVGALTGCIALSAALLSAGAHSQMAPIGTGAFRNVAAIEAQLKRGASTRGDVQRVLGVPNGSGAAAFPVLGEGQREIWYYEDIEVTDAKNEQGTISMNMRQQILLIFLKGEVFDGYLWTTNSGVAEAR